VALADDLDRIARAAAEYALPGEEVTAVLAVEPAAGERAYLCAFGSAEGVESWLVLDDAGLPVTDLKRVRDAASIAALCEVVEETIDRAEPTEPRLASLSYLDSLSAAAKNGDLAAAVQGAVPAVEELTKDVETHYKLELSR
jgi:type IV secretory pathway VirJ component